MSSDGYAPAGAIDFPSDSEDELDFDFETAGVGNEYFEQLLAREQQARAPRGIASLNELLSFEEKALAPLFLLQKSLSKSSDSVSDETRLLHADEVQGQQQVPHGTESASGRSANSTEDPKIPHERLLQLKKARKMRARRRCRDCGCAQCRRCQRLKGTCDASREHLRAWVKANGGRLPRQPSEAPARLRPCVRCGVKCWDPALAGSRPRALTPAHQQQSSGRNASSFVGTTDGSADDTDVQRHTTGSNQTRFHENRDQDASSPPRRKRGRHEDGGTAPRPGAMRNRGRCVECGCSECNKANGGRRKGRGRGAEAPPAVCDASTRIRQQWVEVHGGHPPRRPAVSHLPVCLRCGAPCWSRQICLPTTGSDQKKTASKLPVLPEQLLR